MSGLSTRIFATLLLAVVPAVLLGVAADALVRSAPVGIEPLAVAVGIVACVVIWTMVLTGFATRTLREELRALLPTDRRTGAAGPTAVAESAHHQLAEVLRERDRQVATLAYEVSGAPADGDPQAVARGAVRTVRRVTGDDTWQLAILRPNGTHGIAGRYAPTSGPAPVDELERWAVVAATEDPTSMARRVEGPWGAFLVIAVSAEPDLSAVLFAPWEGRPEPTAAERALLALIGQHTAAALQHAVLYDRVRAQADDLDRMARVQADFLRGVTHDLGTPLASIRALAAEMQSQAGLDDALAADLETIVYQSERLRRMVAQLLVVSRLEGHAIVPRQEVFAVGPLIARTWRALRAERPFEIRPSGPPQLAAADPDRLEQVLWAVLDNAVKYSPPGSPVEVSVGPAGPDRMAIAVQDAGMGMDAETLGHAFDQFYRSARARRDVPDGSGIGLYAARGLVEAMGGTVTLDSQPDRGTTVTLTLPAEPISPESAERPVVADAVPG